jgi:hypothetical protein
MFSSIVLASPSISGITFSPDSSIWEEESLTIEVNCTDSGNSTITKVMAEIVGQDGYIIPNKTLDHKDGGLYEVLIEELYFQETNVFDVDIYCTNNVSEQTIQSSGFTVYNFTMTMLSDTPMSAYIGDKIEFNINVTKNSAAVLYDVDFDVKVNGQEVEAIIEPPYHPEKGWIVYIDAPTSEGTYDLEIFATHIRANDTIMTELTVKEGVQFYIMDIDTVLVEPGDEMSISIRALEGGEIIPLNTEILGVNIDSVGTSILGITPVSDYFTVRIEAPSRSPGSYTLRTWITLGNYSYEDDETVHYAVPISGEFVDRNGDPMSAEMQFFKGNSETLKLSTSGDGEYSGKIQPGTYDVRFVFIKSTLELEDVYVTEFEDPLNYYYSTSADVVTGLKLAGLHVYETVLEFTHVSMEMGYDEANVLDENDIHVYRCINWNSGKNECYGTWKDVTASVDTVKNVVEIESDGLSAYAIGTLKSIVADFEFDKEEYYLNDVVKLVGTTRDSDRNKIENVSLRLRLKGTGIDMSKRSDDSGAFEFEFVAPGETGTYELTLDAEKPPYISSVSSVDFEITRSVTFSIIFPDTIKIKQGESKTYEVELRNIGQTDLSGLEISLTGLPEDYYTMSGTADELKASETKKLALTLSVPEGANRDTYSVTLKVANSDLTREKVFGFTVLSKSETGEEPTSSSSEQPTGLFGKILGNMALPETGTLLLYVITIFFAVGSFTLAFMLRKRKTMGSGRVGVRDEVKNNLFDVKKRGKLGQSVKSYNDNQTADEHNQKDFMMTWSQLKEKWLNGGDLDVGD